MQQTHAAPPATLDAVLERITYANEETGYTVARVATDRSSDLLTVVGALLGAQPGESLRLRGRWASHPQYGRQFQVEAYQTVLPATIQGIRRYLGSGLIKGIGPKMAERIVDHFGEATLEVIEQAPGRLVEVPGLGPKRTGMITAAWEEQKAIKEVMVFLQGVGVSTSLGVRIYKTYQDEAIEVVRREPYRLAGDVWGIGFKTADQIAQRLGIPHDSPQRVKAGLQFALSEATEDGHCYLPEAELVAKATGLLGVEVELASRCLEELVAEEGVVAEPLPADVSPGVPEGTGRALVPGGGLDGRAGLARPNHGRHPGPRAGRGGAAGADRAGGGADRWAGLRQELQRARHRRSGPRQASQGGAGRADRPGGQTAVRAGRVGGGHPASAAAAAPGWGRRL
jgi:exodeoxyribonuclease V alpha subunit